MAEVARVGAAHREQDVEVGDVEVRVVGGGPADPGAEAQIAAQQGRQRRPAPGAVAGMSGGVPEAVGATQYSSGARLWVRTVFQLVAASAPPSARGTEQQPASQLCPVRSM